MALTYEELQEKYNDLAVDYEDFKKELAEHFVFIHSVPVTIEGYGGIEHTGEALKLCYKNKPLEDWAKEHAELTDKIKFMEGYIKTVETARNELEQECTHLKEALREQELANCYMVNAVHSYQFCFEYAKGRIEALMYKDLSDPKTVKYYADAALRYLSYRLYERSRVPNKYKQVLDEIKEIVSKGAKIHDTIIVKARILDVINGVYSDKDKESEENK